MNVRGIKTKRWRTRTGKIKGGKAFNRNAIYTLLKNRVYLGEVFYGEAWQPGAHDPMIDRDLWSKVAALLDVRSRRDESRPSSDEGSIFMLRGRVFGADASGLPRLQAANLNDQVWSSLRRLLSSPEQLIAHLPKPLTERSEFDVSLVTKRLMNLEGLSEELFPIHQKQLVIRLIKRVRVHADWLGIDFNLDGLMDLILELLAYRPDLVRADRQLYSSARGHGL